MVTLAEHVITFGLMTDVDRSDRQDLSLFRLGWDFLEGRLALSDPIPFRGKKSMEWLGHEVVADRHAGECALDALDKR